MPDTVIRAGDDPVTLINVFEVDPSAQQELVDVLVEATEQVMRHRSGFISANPHTSHDRSRVVNYAQWRSRADFERMLADPVAREHMGRCSELANTVSPVSPHLNDVASVHHS